MINNDSRHKNQILFLNGTSSSGKTTLAKELQAILDRPYFHLSSDQFVEAGALPVRREEGGAFAWSQVRPGFFAAFHRTIAAFAEAGNDVIVDHVIEYPEWLAECVTLLIPFSVFFVGVHCPLPELERRERERGNRYIGEAREHLEVVHEIVSQVGGYDFEVDTFTATPRANALLIRDAMLLPRPVSAFEDCRSRV